MTDHPADRPLFSTRLHPHRSLTQRNFLVLMMAFSGCAFFSSLPFVIVGAWPVAGFMGLDVLIFYLAFRANFRAAGAYEDVRVTPVELLIAKVSARGARREWRFNPSWVRLEREELEEFGTQKLAVISRGRRLEIASFLGPDAKADLADGLNRALAQARRGMRFE
jgi:uncharacterized membrane protein